jgi:Na+-driven multidrug efflux pump
MFQALGNTWPNIASSAIRLVVFIVPSLWIAAQPGFQLHQLWYVSVVSMFIQAMISLALIRWQFRERLSGIGGLATPGAPS